MRLFAVVEGAVYGSFVTDKTLAALCTTTGCGKGGEKGGGKGGLRAGGGRFLEVPPVDGGMAIQRIMPATITPKHNFQNQLIPVRAMLCGSVTVSESQHERVFVSAIEKKNQIFPNLHQPTTKKMDQHST